MCSLISNKFTPHFICLSCGMLQGCLRMITTAFQQLTIFIARLVVQVYSGERVVEQCALVTQAEV
jgi:hypothetical protein